jgi:hypothetical protein
VSLLRGCLAKDPDERIQEIASVRAQIEEALAVHGRRPVVLRPMHWSVWRSRFQWALVVVAVFAGGYIACRMLCQRSAAPLANSREHQRRPLLITDLLSGRPMASSLRM